MNFSLLLTILSLLYLCNGESKNERIDRVVTNLLEKYEKAFRPDSPDDPDQPLNVSVQLNIISFGQFNAHEMRFTLLLGLEQIWYDKRLIHPEINDTVNLSGEKDKLWVPDLYFPKSVDGSLHDITVPNMLIWLSPKGKMTYLQKLTVTLGCSLDFSRFPMDNQMCPVEIGSYGFQRKDINLQWRYGNNEIRNVIQTKKNLNEFKIIRIETDNEQTCGKVDEEFRPCVQAKFYFRRNLEYYIVHTYGPNILIVMISWLSFLIDFTVAPARVTLGLIAVLTLITQTNLVYQGMPKISYIKAIDVWLFACLFFVIVALLEFAFVNSLCREGTKPIVTIQQKIKAGFSMIRHKKAGGSSCQARKNDIEASGDKSADEGASLTQVAAATDQPKKKWFRFQKATGYKIDGIFFVIYPTCFIVFNIIYWSVYVSLEE